MLSYRFDTVNDFHWNVSIWDKIIFELVGLTQISLNVNCHLVFKTK